MRKSLSIVLFIVLTACQHVVAKAENATTAESANDFIDMIIPGQYIVYYKQNVDRNAAKQRLFSSASPFRIIRELRKAVAVAGINSAQYQKLLQDPAVAKVVQVRADSCIQCHLSRSFVLSLSLSRSFTGHYHYHRFDAIFV